MSASTWHHPTIAQAYAERDRSTRRVGLVIDLFDHWSDATAGGGSPDAGAGRPRLCGGYCSVDYLHGLEAAA